MLIVHYCNVWHIAILSVSWAMYRITSYPETPVITHMNRVTIKKTCYLQLLLLLHGSWKMSWFCGQIYVTKYEMLIQ